MLRNHRGGITGGFSFDPGHGNNIVRTGSRDCSQPVTPLGFKRDGLAVKPISPQGLPFCAHAKPQLDFLSPIWYQIACSAPLKFHQPYISPNRNKYVDRRFRDVLKYFSNFLGTALQLFEGSYIVPAGLCIELSKNVPKAPILIEGGFHLFSFFGTGQRGSRWPPSLRSCPVNRILSVTAL